MQTQLLSGHCPSPSPRDDAEPSHRRWAGAPIISHCSKPLAKGNTGLPHPNSHQLQAGAHLPFSGSCSQTIVPPSSSIFFFHLILTLTLRTPCQEPEGSLGMHPGSQSAASPSPTTCKQPVERHSNSAAPQRPTCSAPQIFELRSPGEPQSQSN